MENKKLKKTILFCGNGMSGEIIPDVKSWGYDVALISEFPNDVGAIYADYYVEANSKDPTEALKAAEKLNASGVSFDGVMSLCWDCAISVSAIAKRYQLFSVSEESALISTDKLLRSNAFKKANVPAPKFEVFRSKNEAHKLVEEFEFPIIVKPIDQSSSKGVVLVRDIEDLDAAIDCARTYSSSPTLLLNEYIEGSEHSSEGLMIDGELHLTALSDRVFLYDQCEPFFVEVGDVMPTCLATSARNEIRQITQDAAMALGIEDGVVKGDIVVSHVGDVKIFELAARLGGPRFGTEMVPLSNGTNILKAAIQQATRSEVDPSLLIPKFQRGMVNRSVFPMPGQVTSISGFDCLNKLEGFHSFKWWQSEVEVGDSIKPFLSSCGDVGYFIATGEDREHALLNADRIERNINIETE